MGSSNSLTSMVLRRCQESHVPVCLRNKGAQLSPDLVLGVGIASVFVCLRAYCTLGTYTAEHAQGAECADCQLQAELLWVQHTP